MLHLLKDHRYTFLCGAAGPLSISAVINSLLDEKADSRDRIKQLKDLYLNHKSDFKADSSSELLYGHVGYLYALLFVNCYIPGAVEEDLIGEASSKYCCRLCNS